MVNVLENALSLIAQLVETNNVNAPAVAHFIALLQAESVAQHINSLRKH